MTAAPSTLIDDNAPGLWRPAFPFPRPEHHKYSRGVALIRGGALMTGAVRLAARAAQRAGAGLVTIAAPTSVLPVYAAAFESVIVRPCDMPQNWQALIDDQHAPSLLIGPGLGIGAAQRDDVLRALSAKRPTVVDADGLTSFEDKPSVLFDAFHDRCVLTPHEGEFLRLFANMTGDRVVRAQAAAKRAGCVVVLKGAETVVADPSGCVVVNRNAPAWLATAGAGDVLSGMILGLIAQGMPVFLAAAAAVWMHGRCAYSYGPGLVAEDIVSEIPSVLKEILNFPLADTAGT